MGVAFAVWILEQSLVNEAAPQPLCRLEGKPPNLPKFRLVQLGQWVLRNFPQVHQFSFQIIASSNQPMV